MRGGHDHVCGCFPTGRHYPGIADRIARAAVDTIEGVSREFDVTELWTKLPFAVIDFETTGREAGRDRIVEAGVVCFRDGQITARHGILINPEIPIPEEAAAVHGIRNGDVVDAPKFEEAMPDLVAALSGHLPVAYNAAFDRGFLHAEFDRARGSVPLEGELPPALDPDVVWIDPLVWTREILQELKSRALGDVCAHLGIDLTRAHRATDDAEATGKVMLAIADHMPRTYGELVRLQARYAARQDAEMAAWRNRRPS